MNLNNKTNAELLEIQKAIESDPSNKEDGLFLYTKKAPPCMSTIKCLK